MAESTPYILSQLQAKKILINENSLEEKATAPTLTPNMAEILKKCLINQSNKSLTIQG